MENLLPKIEWIDVTKVKVNDKNPRMVKRKDFKQLVDRMREFPEMLGYRPLILDKTNKLIAGEQRYRAALELDRKRVPFIKASKLTPKQVKQFMLWDNDHAGSFDWAELGSWENVFGIEMPSSFKDKNRFTNENCEMPIVPKFDEKYHAVLIVVKTEMDFANLATILELGREKNYKGITVKQTQVISYERFTEILKSWKK